jgi:hypothetical protein
MTKENPSDRITMQEALAKFDEIVAGLSASPIASWKVMTSAPVSRTPYPVDARLARAAQHLLRRFKYILLRLPPIPSAPPSPAPPTKKELPSAAADGAPRAVIEESAASANKPTGTNETP